MTDPLQYSEIETEESYQKDSNSRKSCNSYTSSLVRSEDNLMRKGVLLPESFRTNSISQNCHRAFTKYFFIRKLENLKRKSSQKERNKNSYSKNQKSKKLAKSNRKRQHKISKKALSLAILLLRDHGMLLIKKTVMAAKKTTNSLFESGKASQFNCVVQPTEIQVREQEKKLTKKMTKNHCARNKTKASCFCLLQLLCGSQQCIQSFSVLFFCVQG